MGSNLPLREPPLIDRSCKNCFCSLYNITRIKDLVLKFHVYNLGDFQEMSRKAHKRWQTQLNIELEQEGQQSSTSHPSECFITHTHDEMKKSCTMKKKWQNFLLTSPVLLIISRQQLCYVKMKFLYVNFKTVCKIFPTYWLHSLLQKIWIQDNCSYNWKMWFPIYAGMFVHWAQKLNISEK